MDELRPTSLTGSLAAGISLSRNGRGIGVDNIHPTSLTDSLAARTRLSRNGRGIGIDNVRPTSLSASRTTVLTPALAGTLTTTLSAAVRCWYSSRVRRSRSSLFIIATGSTGFPRRVAPAFATSNWCPAIRLVGIEILNWWRGRVVAFGIIRTVEVQWQGRVVLWIGFLIVCPLLMLGRLSPGEVVGQGWLGKPVVCVGGLNETLGSGKILVKASC